MSLEHALLGFLNYCPLTGYDLKKVFDSSVRHFWPADQSQIYRSLSRLSENGWATVEVKPQDNRPDRKVFHITDPGREELTKWLTGPIPLEVDRSAPLIQVFFAGLLDDEFAINYFKAGASMIRDVLNTYRGIPENLYQRIMKEIPGIENLDERDQFFWLLTLESGINNMRSTLVWMESVIERLEKKDYTNRLNLE
jgi:DNA-binding PadR family transcriptional regulator